MKRTNCQSAIFLQSDSGATVLRNVHLSRNKKTAILFLLWNDCFSQKLTFQNRVPRIIYQVHIRASNLQWFHILSIDHMLISFHIFSLYAICKTIIGERKPNKTILLGVSFHK